MSDMFSPLTHTVFRRAWGGSVLTNLGMLIQGVGVSWVMVEIATQDAMVAWVQAATWLPLMLLSIPAGAVSDVFNRRRVALSGLLIALAGASALMLTTFLGAITPELLLTFCFLTGIGMAFYDPAWQASVPSLVPLEKLPQAIALRSISQNLARAIGPAIGGVLVAWQGGSAAFLCAVIFFIPLIAVLHAWNYDHPTPRLPPERIDEAVTAGIRFVMNSPSTRKIVYRGFIVGVLGIGILALMPLAAKYRLDGSAIQYGIMLGAFGVGAVAGAGCISFLRKNLTEERRLSLSMLSLALGAFAMALSSKLVIISCALVLSGMGWLIIFSTLNISVQTAAPRWVMGRALATYAAATTGGMALGSLIWGELIDAFAIETVLFILGAACAASSLIGRWIRFPNTQALSIEASERVDDVPLALSITHRSGPILIEKEYRIAADSARRFYKTMQKIERQRKRNGAYDWSLSRSLTDETRWYERYHLSTWLDYLRVNDRSTDRDVRSLREINAMLLPETEVITKHCLERPVGSVRWKEDVIDPGVSTGQSSVMS